MNVSLEVLSHYCKSIFLQRFKVREHKDGFYGELHYATHSHYSVQNWNLDLCDKMINSPKMKRGRDSVKKILSTGSP